MRHAQRQARVRMEWGQAGAEAICQGADVAVIVDVLSFTTTLTVAIDAGAEVYPYRWNDESARDFARLHNATLAVGRFEANAAVDLGSAISLSPATLRRAGSPARIVLPSPNGSALSRILASGGTTVVAAGLRNRAAVARWIADRLASNAAGRTDAASEAEPAGAARPAIAVIAAGERWPDSSLRPAVEDLWGAGAVIAALSELGIGDQSPEAWAAEAAFRGVEGSLGAELADCSSGQELALAGFGEDVAIAAELDVSECVPVLIGERFLNGG
jgi:2-phosphosulfolactate phosphatase